MRSILAAVLLTLAPVSLAGPPGLAPQAPGTPATPRPPGPPPHVLDEVRQQEPEILAWLSETDPESYERLMRVKQRDPRSYLGHLMRASRIMRRAEQDPSVVERHRAMQALEQQIREKVVGFDALEPKAQKEARTEILGLAGELFDLKQEERRSQLDAIRAKATELEAEIEERDGNRKGFIQDWVDDLLEEPADL